MSNTPQYIHKKTYRFPNKSVEVFFGATVSDIQDWLDTSSVFIITDENINQLYKTKLERFPHISIKPGESSKQYETIKVIIEKMLDAQLSKQTTVIGVGGGVVSDIAGFVASIFKRGTKLILMPTSLLGMVDAALGGKNGIDAGIYKNMVGTVYQPDKIIYDYSFLNTLPKEEWINGFAEIIKHGCIRDEQLFSLLEKHSLEEFRLNTEWMADLIERNVDLKMDIVTKDEYDQHDRQLLNFGHTIGHALENLHQLPHGHAVSIGMVAACVLSEKLADLHFEDAARVVKLLAKYHLPVDVDTDYNKLYDAMCMDKKRQGDNMQFVLMDKIGSASAVPVPMHFLRENLRSLL